MKKKVLISVFIFLLLIPLIRNGNLYYLGGDDMRLYYLFPQKYLENYVFNYISGNTLAGANTGFATVAYFAPMFYFINVLKLVPLNTQFLMYGLNLSIGFLFFYKFLGLYIKNNWITKLSVSLFYVLSPFLIATLYRNQLLSMYLISIIPLCLYLFIRAVREERYYLSFFAVLVFSVFSTTINTMPWWSGFLITASLLLLKEFYHRPKSFVLNTLFITISFISLNFYWIGDFIKSQFSDSLPSANLSQSFKDDNLRVMKGVSTLHKPYDIVFNNSGTNSADMFGLSGYMNFLYFGVVIVAGLLINKTTRLKKIIFSLLIFSFLLSWYMYSPNISKLGPKIFVYLGENVPYFGMYRNMYDKFSLSLAFFYALLTGYSLSIIANKSKLVAKIISLILIFLTFYNARDYLLFKYTPNQEINRLSGTFNDDFTNLVEYFESLSEKSKIVWLPLNYPTYVNIEDKYLPGHFYSGLSPMRILADRSDYAGGFSFITQSDYSVGDSVWKFVELEDTENLGRLLQSRNAKYVVVDKQMLPSTIKSFMYGGEGLPKLKTQEKFMNELLGSKIASFGNRYDLYNVNPRFENSLIYISDNEDLTYTDKSSINFKKINNKLYEVGGLDFSETRATLVFLESFNKGWKLIDTSGQEIKTSHNIAFDYANKWVLDQDILKRLNGNLIIKFDY